MNAVILIGGKSSRMGQAKHEILRPDGKTNLDFLVSLLEKTKLPIYLSVREGTQIDSSFPIIIDDVIDGGPLAALSSAVTKLETSILFIACDLMHLDEKTLIYLIENHDSSKLATCFTNRLDGKPEPLCAIYEPACLSLLNLDDCARHFIRSLEPKILDSPNPVALDNINNPYDLAEVFAKIEQGILNVKVKISYHAMLREARGVSEEVIKTYARTAAGLYAELQFKHRLPINHKDLKVAKNGDFSNWSTAVADGDEFVFLQPFSGG
jgi:molybdenum cofactor guanylyltransferase